MLDVELPWDEVWLEGLTAEPLEGIELNHQELDEELEDELQELHDEVKSGRLGITRLPFANVGEGCCALRLEGDCVSIRPQAETVKILHRAIFSAGSKTRSKQCTFGGGETVPVDDRVFRLVNLSTAIRSFRAQADSSERPSGTALPLRSGRRSPGEF